MTALMEGDAYTYLLGEGPQLLTVQQAADTLHLSRQSVIALIEAGHLEAHCYHSPQGQGKKTARRIPRRSLLLYLARTASTPPEYLEPLMENLFLSLSEAARKRLATRFYIANSGGLVRPRQPQS